MKIFLQTLAVAFGMFSAVPLPQPVWNKQNMRYALCAFPAVGLVSGAGLLGFAALCRALGAGSVLRAAGLCLLPVLVTGGIHLDGFADTCDALASCAPPEKKQQILADPHCGAFAVIRLCSWFLACFAVARFPLAKNTGLAHTFATAADRAFAGRFLAVLAGVCVAAQAVCARGPGIGAALAALLCLWRYRAVAQKQFGGISGDLAGWFLTRCELWQLAAAVVCQMAESVL